jgi:hypothetical protein
MNVVFWYVTQYGSCKTQPFRANYCFVPKSQSVSTLMKEATRSFETPFLTRSTKHHISEDGIPYVSVVFDRKRNSLNQILSYIISLDSWALKFRFHLSMVYLTALRGANISQYEMKNS